MLLSMCSIIFTYLPNAVDKIMPSRRSPYPNPELCKYVTLHGKIDFADTIWLFLSWLLDGNSILDYPDGLHLII